MYQKQIYQGSESLCEVGSQNKNPLPDFMMIHYILLLCLFGCLVVWLFFNGDNFYVNILLQTLLMQDFD